jgi:IS30 family transposase
MENKRKRRKLSLMTSETIYSMRRQGCKIREIARHVGFNASVVSREFKRNRPPSKVVLVTGIERAGWAHAQAQRRLKERKRGKRGAIMIEDVPHRHTVFTIPKRLRVFFKYDRKLNTILFRAAWGALKEVLGVDERELAAIFTVQTAGEALN